VATSTWRDDYLTAGSHLYSTYLANTVDTFSSLADRITYSLGYPTINLELHGHQIFTNITLAVELFSKFAGYTLEHLVVDSSIYTIGKGLDISKLFLLTPELTATYTTDIEVTVSQQMTVPPVTAASFTDQLHLSADQNRFIPLFTFDSSDDIIDPSDYTWVMTLDDGNAHIEKSIVICKRSINLAVSGVQIQVVNYGMSRTTTTDSFQVTAFPWDTDVKLTDFGPAGDTTYTNAVSIGIVTGSIDEAPDPDVLLSTTTQGGTVQGTRNVILADTTTLQQLTATSPSIGRWDGLTRQNRKVIDVFSYDESTSSSLNTLFTIEQTLAQQTYFSYAMGNYGFDLISWYILKQWLETRQKMLSTKRYFKFNDRTQHLQFIPEPKGQELFYGVVSCHVEKHIKDLIKEPWVYQYASALTKITLGRIRGKFGGAQLFGGTSLDTSLLQEGLDEKKELELKMFEGASPGFGDAAPPMFFVG